MPESAFLSIDLTLPDSLIGKIGALDVSSVTEDSKEDSKERKESDVIGMKVRGLNAGEALRLKRFGREFDVDGARAEWRIGEGKLVVLV